MAEQEWNTVIIRGEESTTRAATFTAELIRNGIVFKVEERVLDSKDIEYTFRFSGGF